MFFWVSWFLWVTARQFTKTSLLTNAAREKLREANTKNISNSCSSRDLGGQILNSDDWSNKC